MNDRYPHNSDDSIELDELEKEQLQILENRLLSLTNEMIPSTGYKLTLEITPSRNTQSIIEAHTETYIDKSPISIDFYYDEIENKLDMKEVRYTTKSGQPMSIMRLLGDDIRSIDANKGDCFISRPDGKYNFQDLIRPAEVGDAIFKSLKIPEIPASNSSAHRLWLAELVSGLEGYTLTETMNLANTIGDYSDQDGQIIQKSEYVVAISRIQHLDNTEDGDVSEDRRLDMIHTNHVSETKTETTTESLSHVKHFRPSGDPILSVSSQKSTAEDDPFVINYQYETKDQPTPQPLDGGNILRWSAVADVAAKFKEELKQFRSK